MNTMVAPNSPDQFWGLANVRDPDECWPWTRPTKHGYGNFRLVGERRANRVAYVLAYGPIPPGHFVCHRCDNKACVNPAHLFVGTHAENMADMVSKGRSPRAPSGAGSQHYRTGLTSADVLAMRALRGEGVILRDIAARFGMSIPGVASIVSGRTWKHVGN